MKTYMCDVCGEFVQNPTKHIYMQEITSYGEKFGKKKRIHLCDQCLRQIAEISRKKRSDTE